MELISKLSIQLGATSLWVNGKQCNTTVSIICITKSFQCVFSLTQAPIPVTTTLTVKEMIVYVGFMAQK